MSAHHTPESAAATPAAQPVSTHLVLRPSADLPREMRIEFEARGSLRTLTVAIQPPPKRAKPYAHRPHYVFALADVSECYCSRGGYEGNRYWSLWIDGAAFRISDSEVEQLRTAFAPFGLRIDEQREGRP